MGDRWDKRERLIRLARSFGLTFPASISDNALRRLVDDAPATPNQKLFIAEVLRHYNRKPPRNMTFGQARKAIAAAAEEFNDHAIRSMQLVEGMVRAWRDKYYLILRIYGSQMRYQIRIQQVALSRQANAPQAIMRPIGSEWVVHPHELLYVSAPVDLKTWQPTPKKVYRLPDEPDF